jgi:hypothetical protein
MKAGSNAGLFFWGAPGAWAVYLVYVEQVEGQNDKGMDSFRDYLRTRSHRHPGEGRGPELSKTWIPAFAGMTFNGLCAILR